MLISTDDCSGTKRMDPRLAHSSEIGFGNWRENVRFLCQAAHHSSGRRWSFGEIDVPRSIGSKCLLHQNLEKSGRQYWKEFSWLGKHWDGKCSCNREFHLREMAVIPRIYRFLGTSREWVRDLKLNSVGHFWKTTVFFLSPISLKVHLSWSDWCPFPRQPVSFVARWRPFQWNRHYWLIRYWISSLLWTWLWLHFLISRGHLCTKSGLWQSGQYRLSEPTHRSGCGHKNLSMSCGEHSNPRWLICS